MIGGSACPRAMTQKFQDIYGVEVIHAWGMTEMSPLGTACTLKPGICRPHRRRPARHPAEAGPSAVQGRDEDRPTTPASALPWDGKTFGRLKVRGPAVAEALFQGRRRRHPRPGRLLRHRRRRHHGPLRLHADHRPLQGRDQVRRRMDFLDRSREPRGRPSQGRRSRGDRRPPSQMGRAAAARRRA